MKRKIKLLVTILVSSFLASSSISVQEQNIVYAMENIISVDDIDVSFCMKQNESIEKYQQMISEFNINNRARGSAIQYYDDN